VTLDDFIDSAFRMVKPIFNVESVLKEAARGVNPDSPLIAKKAIF
jgi:hypothetical protein